ncbi:hypothetical protein CDL12_10125 [Handroanthus impetiginosus]|uniref:Uncharacterized protein n=1 Tax=Handroanthus impetiginosus TaxID=429701 RepID=A0A2G9HI54_9LAMI|nr:hypothetical protein CDL12_10125 [Handroanthus impetiginosus]
MAHVVINLEFALELQEKAKSSAKTEIVEVLLPQVNAISLLPNEITNVANATPLPPSDKTQQEKTKSLSPNEITSVADALPYRSRNMLLVIGKQLTRVSFKVQSGTSTLREQINSKMINAGNKDG